MLERYDDGAVVHVFPTLYGGETVCWVVEIDGEAIHGVDVRIEELPERPDWCVMSLVRGDEEVEVHRWSGKPSPFGPWAVIRTLGAIRRGTAPNGVARRLFISGGDTDHYGDGVRRFVEGLQAAGFSLTWSPIGALEYRKVCPLVLASEAVVALVTGGWGTSTYHAVEVTTGLGEAWEGYGPRPSYSPLPVFAYVEDHPLGEGWFHDRIRSGLIVVLPDDPDKAVAAVQAGLDLGGID